MATTTFPTRRDFYVFIGDKNEGINFEVDGGATDNFTGYSITLAVKCPNGQSFTRTQVVTTAAINVATTVFVLLDSEMALLGEGASNFYTTMIISTDQTWKKVCFDGAIYGRR